MDKLEKKIVVRTDRDDANDLINDAGKIFDTIESSAHQTTSEIEAKRKEIVDLKTKIQQTHAKLETGIQGMERMPFLDSIALDQRTIEKLEADIADLGHALDDLAEDGEVVANDIEGVEKRLRDRLN